MGRLLCIAGVVDDAVGAHLMDDAAVAIGLLTDLGEEAQRVEGHIKAAHAQRAEECVGVVTAKPPRVLR